MSAVIEAPVETPVQPFRFTGSGAEYFRIWIVNLLLTILTLGIYSAWAKVRRLKYFYGNTEVAGARFDFHGEPLTILKGRLFAVALFVLYTASTSVASIWSLVGLALLALLLPWLLRNSLRFRARNSSYRGLRFGFDGSVARAYMVFLLYPLLMFFSLYLLGPLFHAKLKHYQHGNARLGTTQASFHASVGRFYKTYLPIIGLVALMFLAASFIMFLSIVMSGALAPGAEPSPRAAMASTLAFVGVLMVGSMLIAPFWQARTQNLIWNHTQLGAHRFRSELHTLPLLGIQLSNLLLIALTLGLFTPWAAVRVARYRASTMQLLPAGDLDAFLASQEQQVSAAGEEAAEIFDFDIGL